jgi:O-antigen ligase
VSVWSKGLVLFILLAAVADNIKQMRVLAISMGLGGAVITIISAVAGQMSADDRLRVPGSTMSNPNDLAQLILITIPFWIYAAATRKNPFLKYTMFAAVIPMLVVLLKTGSRGAMVVIAILAIVLLFSLGMRGLALAIPLAAVGAISLFLLPSTTVDRLLTTFSQKEEATYLEASAVASRESRLFLFREGVRLTLENPVFGVGADGFIPAANPIDADTSGLRPTKWQETHNAYVQISSETGIPGFLLYYGAMFLAFRQLSSIRKKARAQDQSEVANVALCIRFSLLAFAASSLFSNYAYLMYFPTLAGLTVAVERIARETLRPAAARNVRMPVPASQRFGTRP